MIDPTQYPTLDKLTAYLALPHCDGAPLSVSGVMCNDVAAELTALKAERDALIAENAALNAVVSDANETMKAMDDEISALKSARPKPVRAACGCLGAAHPRKLREVKGVTYGKSESGREEGWKIGERIFVGSDAVSLLISWVTGLTDADHAAIYALKDDPYEPVETVEAVLHDLHKAIYDDKQTFRGSLNVHHYAARIRAARDAETGGDADA